MIEIDELWNRIDAAVMPLGAEEIPVLEAIGRQLVASVPASIDFPGFDHSSMDGYVFAEERPGRCRIVESIAAGESPVHAIHPGEAARILTGSPIPSGTFAVAMQEDCERSDGWVSPKFGAALQLGSHIRRRAEILQAGQSVMAACEEIPAGAVAMLTACGVEYVRVARRPRPMHVSTGSELLATGEESTQGKIPDSNGPMMAALLAGRGIPLVRHRMRDESAALAGEVQHFDGDLLLISGGSGPGDHDHTRSALESGGFTIHSERVNSRPGKPLLFASRGRQLAFGLPGNPLSHWVCYQAFVRRALDRLESKNPPLFVQTYCPGWPGPEGDGRQTWTPAFVKIVVGRAESVALPWRHSGDLSPLLAANALLLDSPHPTSQLVRTLLL